MRGDFSRFGFDLDRSFSRILHQQGRVALDADANGQQAINLHLVRTLAADLIGPHGGSGDGFKIGAAGEQLAIAPGRYYVDGWMCENRGNVGYRANGALPVQPWLADAPEPGQGRHIVYLEVWERHLTAAELDPLDRPTSPRALREVALGGADTASRAQVVWQVRLVQDGPANRADFDWAQVIERLHPARRGRLSAEVEKPGPVSNDPCDVSPRARYRGIENQLYRIEIAKGGDAKAGGATFVWSRENGAVTFPVESIAGDKVKLADVWRDSRFGLAVRNIVEIVGERSGLGGPREFRQVVDYDPDSATVTLDAAPHMQSAGPERPLLLRRWDQVPRSSNTDRGAAMTPEHTLTIVEDRPTAIEEGILVTFEASGATPCTYRAGDYWLIPARTVLGDILWPRNDAGPEAIEPHGVERHFAPLATVVVAAGAGLAVKDARRLFQPLARPPA
jgi:hypothetical protein